MRPSHTSRLPIPFLQAFDPSGGLDYRDPYNTAIQAAMALPPNSTDANLAPIIRVRSPAA